MCKQVNRALASILLLVLALALVPKLAWAADLQGDSDVEVHVTAEPTEGWNEYDTIEWCVFENGELVIRPRGGAPECSIETLWYTYSEPWDAVRESITSVCVEGTIHWSGMTSFMFEGCTNLVSADLSGLDTTSVTNMMDMFYGCSSLQTLNLSRLDASNVTYMGHIFKDCSSLASISLPASWPIGLEDALPEPTATNGKWWSVDSGAWFTNDEIVSQRSGIADTYTNRSTVVTDGWNEYDTIEWRIDNGELVIRPLGGADECEIETSWEWGDAPWDWDSYSITSVRFEGTVHWSGDMGTMFHDCSNLASVNFAGLDTSNVADMGCMFYNCSSLTSLDLSPLDASSVADMRSMFHGCSSLASFSVPASWPVDLDGAIPESTNGSGWYSAEARAWFSNDEIRDQRKGIADTYLNEAEAIPISAATIAAIPAQTYTGKALKPKINVTLDGAALAENTDFTVDYAKNTNVGTAIVTVTGIGGYEGTATATFAINKAAQPMTAKAKKASLSVTYNASKAQATATNVVVAGAKGTVTYVNASTNATAKKFTVNGSTGAVSVPKGTKAGTYAVIVKATAAGNANYKAGTKTVSYKIVVDKAANTLTAKAVDRSASAKTLKSQAVTVAAPLSVSKAQGTVTYAKAGGAKQLAINTKTGKVTVSKGTTKGTYTIKVKVTAAGNANYNKASKTVTCKVVVK